MVKSVLIWPHQFCISLRVYFVTVDTYIARFVNYFNREYVSFMLKTQKNYKNFQILKNFA